MPTQPVITQSTPTASIVAPLATLPIAQPSVAMLPLALMINNVNTDTTYYYWLKTVNATSSSLSLAANSSIAIPSTPSQLTVSAQGSHVVQLNWQLVANTAEYAIMRSTDAMFSNASTIGNVNQSYDSFQDGNKGNGLITDSTYTYWVLACNTLGCSGATSTSVHLLSSPTALMFTAQTTNSISLSWQDHVNAHTYLLQRSTADNNSNPDQFSTTTNNYSDTDLHQNTTYTYSVKACNDNGCSDSSSLISSKTLLAKPPAPTGLVATTPNNNQIDLSWDAIDASYNIQQYYVYLATLANHNDRTTHAITSAIHFSHSGLLFTDATLYYWVKACNASGCSGFSPVVAAHTEGVDFANVSTLSVSSGVLTWNTVSGVSFYQVQRTTNSSLHYIDGFQDLAEPVNPPYTLPWIDSAASYRVRACLSGTPANCSTDIYLRDQNNATVIVPPAKFIELSGLRPC